MRNEEAMCEGLLSVVIPVYNIRCVTHWRRRTAGSQ